VVATAKRRSLRETRLCCVCRSVTSPHMRWRPEDQVRAPTNQKFERRILTSIDSKTRKASSKRTRENKNDPSPDDRSPRWMRNGTKAKAGETISRLPATLSARPRERGGTKNERTSRDKTAYCSRQRAEYCRSTKRCVKLGGSGAIQARDVAAP